MFDIFYPKFHNPQVTRTLHFIDHCVYHIYNNTKIGIK